MLSVILVFLLLIVLSFFDNGVTTLDNEVVVQSTPTAYELDYTDSIEEIVIKSYNNNTEEPTEKPTPNVTNTPDNRQTAWINVDYLKIRTQPNTDSTAIGKILYGEALNGIYE